MKKWWVTKKQFLVQIRLPYICSILYKFRKKLPDITKYFFALMRHILQNIFFTYAVKNIYCFYRGLYWKKLARKCTRLMMFFEPVLIIETKFGRSNIPENSGNIFLIFQIISFFGCFFIIKSRKLVGKIQKLRNPISDIETKKFTFFFELRKRGKNWEKIDEKFKSKKLIWQYLHFFTYDFL